MTRLTPWIFLLAVWAVAWPNLASSPPNLEKALEAQHEQISMDPRNPVAWNDLGNLLSLADRFSEAEEAYRQALALAPDDSSARFNLALLLHQVGRLDDAKEELEQLISTDPHHAWAHYQLGVILAGRRDRDGALEHYAKALAYDPLLSFPENNPHIIENKLFSEALIRSQRYYESAATRVPRQYGEAERIVELMLKEEMEAAKADEGEEEGEKEEGEESEVGEEEEGGGQLSARTGGAARSKGSGGVPAAAPDTSDEASSLARRTPSAERRRSATGRTPTLRSTTVGEPQPTPRADAEDSPEAADRRSISRYIPPRRAVPPPSTLERRTPPPASAAEAPEGARGSSTLQRTPPPPPPRTSRFIPSSRRSTSQLELRLLPAEESPVRYASLEPGRGG